MLMNKVRNVFLIAMIVAAVCAGGRLEAVDQAQALGSASAETSSLGMRGVVIILVPSLPRFLGRIFRLVSSRMVPSRSMGVPPISMCASGMLRRLVMVTARRMCLLTV